jgi:hypothetical protein
MDGAMPAGFRAVDGAATDARQVVVGAGLRSE